MQTLIGILIGTVFAAFGYAIYWLVRSVREVKASLDRTENTLLQAVNVFAQMGTMIESMQAQVGALRRLVTAVESNTVAVNTFNSLIVRNPEAPPENPGELQTPRQPRGTPPPPPAMTEDGYAPEGESAVLSQTDEEMAENETAVAARELGIETDADLVMMPPPEKINQL